MSDTDLPSPLRRLSTADVPATQALDYYATLMQDALVPMHVQCPSRSSFHASVESAPLGRIELLRMVGSPHRVVRGRSELERSERRLYNLMVNRLAPWTLVQRGGNRLRAGDAILLDSALPHELEVGTYELVNIAMSADFVEQWLPDPSVLTSRPLQRDRRWSAPLARFIAQLTPEFALGACPLPDEVMTQQIGALLMLAAGDFSAPARTLRPSLLALHDSIVAFLHERVADVDLTPADTCAALGIDERSLHDILAAHGETFAVLLLRMRIREAARLGASSDYQDIEADDLARKAGFKDRRRLASAIGRQAGMTPP